MFCSWPCLALRPLVTPLKHRRADEVVGDVVDILAAMGDFDEFKGMMVAHRAGHDNGLVVTSSPAAAANFPDLRDHQQSESTLSDPSTKSVASRQGGVPVRRIGACDNGGASPRGGGRARRASDPTTHAEERKW